jgi:hypothetical protein
MAAARPHLIAVNGGAVETDRESRQGLFHLPAPFLLPHFSTHD